LWELPLSSKPKPGAELVLATKQIQENPRKTKQNRLDLLGFIRPNRGFSMGYSESK
jgi:hypothetical protein